MTLSLVIRGGLVLDGTGAPARRADVGIDGDRIAVVGPLDSDIDADEIDATGLCVSPGFINVLSHAWDTLQVEPYGRSDLLQGVTTEVFGEGISLGPTSAGIEAIVESWGRIPGSRTDFVRLADGLDHLAGAGTALNVASFVGGHNLRALAGGLEDAPLPSAALDRIRGVLDEELADGALGLGTALIYPPGCYAGTDELLALAEVVGRHDGLYVSHLRSEADRFLEALAELIGIGRRAAVRAEVYHLKAGGRANWPAMSTAVEAIEAARSTGPSVSASMYPYTAGATALTACIPPRHHGGGPDRLARRLADPTTRHDIAAEIGSPSGDWENLYLAAGGGRGILLLDDLPDGTPVAGRRLDELARVTGQDEVGLLLDICRQAPGTLAAFFTVDEANLQLGLRQPWVSICSDAPALTAAPPWTDAPAHPRTYGSFARVLGHYRREVGLLDLAEAVRRMTGLPARTLRLDGRGILAPDAYADVVVFDPDTVADTSTYDAPHRYAVGVRHVLVNGVPALREGTVTGALPGRRLRRAR